MVLLKKVEGNKRKRLGPCSTLYTLLVLKLRAFLLQQPVVVHRVLHAADSIFQPLVTVVTSTVLVVTVVDGPHG